MKQRFSKKLAFTLIELLVVIAIIAILATLAIVSLQNARSKARDVKRLADIKQIQTALELYFTDNGGYPTELNFNGQSSLAGEDGTVYMGILPSAPTPADGDCSTEDNTYKYNSDGGASYELHFCIGKKSGDFEAGNKVASPAGILGGGPTSGSSGNGGNPVYSNPAGHVCINPNPGFEEIEEELEYWWLNSINIYGPEPKSNFPIISSDVHSGYKAIKLRGNSSVVSIVATEFSVSPSSEDFNLELYAKGYGNFNILLMASSDFEKINGSSENVMFWNFINNDWDSVYPNEEDLFGFLVGPENSYSYKTDVSSSNYTKYSFSSIKGKMGEDFIDGISINIVSKSSNILLDDIKMSRGVSSENLLPDGSFEIFNIISPGYQFSGGGDQSKIESVLSNVHNGSKSVKIENSSNESPGEIFIGRDTIYGIDFSKKINLSFFAKTSQPEITHLPYIRFDFFNDSGEWVDVQSVYMDSISDSFDEYKIYNIASSSSSGLSKIEVSIQSASWEYPYVMWIDDLCLYYDEG